MKYIIILLLIANTTFAQSGKVYETYKTISDGTNESNGTIFNKPFQQFNYVKTSRGIEVYETYKTIGDSTNQSRGTIFSKPFPEYIIIKDKMYKTYKTSIDNTNESHGTIFTKPFESKNIQVNNLKENIKAQTSYSTYKGPTYDGETYNSGDGE